MNADNKTTSVANNDTTSIANAVASIRFNPKAGTYTAIIQSPSGDLYQEYEGEQGNILSVFPDFTKSKKDLVFICTSSRVAEGIVVPLSMKYYFNDVLLTFGSNNVSTTVINGETGHFVFKGYVAGTQDLFGLQIVKNLVNASGLAQCTIKAVAKVAYANFIDNISASYSIPIYKSTGSQYRVTIASNDTKYFTILDKKGSCSIKAIAYQGSNELTTGLTYKWYKLVAGGWSVLTGYTSKSITVTAAMVDSCAQFKVEVYKDGTLIGNDTQGVMDASDPYDIILNPVPADQTICEAGDTVTYTPYVVKRGTSVKALDTLFYFIFTDSVGIVLNPSTSNTASASGTATYAMCEQAGSDLGVTIITQQ